MRGIEIRRLHGAKRLRARARENKVFFLYAIYIYARARFAPSLDRLTTRNLNIMKRYENNFDEVYKRIFL